MDIVTRLRKAQQTFYGDTSINELHMYAADEIERLREALKFYADPENYEFKIGDTAVMTNVEYCEVIADQGMAARAALKGDE